MTRGRVGTSAKRIGLLGAGTVGSALCELIGEADLNAAITQVLVRDPEKARAGCVPHRALTTDADAVLENSDVVVELMGGTGLASELMLRALAAGKRVVTANKAVLAEQWDAFSPFLEAGTLYFEAAVMAGTPTVGPLSGALRGSKPQELHAILNGTCNYILGELEAGAEFKDALNEAQRLGYAEADPSLDVGGFDAAHKLTILGRLAFDPALSWEAVKANTHGIGHLTPAIVKEAMEDGGRLRLVGSIYPEEGRWRAAVRPVYLPPEHPLSGSASNRNGLLFKGDAVGEVLITGAGAGAAPTASAVLADLLDALAERPGPRPLQRSAPVPEGYEAQPLGEVLLVGEPS
ncbi:MAG: Homoserine dehydrogenase [uncultured Truepera sp.]|uniref:Homoserine dehydrogenase n=1 Tax=uncultured Truepera sp. TaxID=543023 RepID=A0A6J4UNP9_9DEIN|nr:MAG: Homoserine dehydrogenase [uncultured Truepera sp.]